MAQSTEYRVKEYPLDIEETDLGYFSKGWQAKTEFLEEVRFQAECAGDDVLHGFWNEGDVRYEVWRCVPEQDCDEYVVYYWPAKLGTHGAFPVTVVGG